MKVVYPGSFDPITFGHVEVVERALKLFSEVTFLVANSSQKPSFFTFEERKALIKAVFKNDPRITVQVANGLTTDFLKDNGYKFILRALRNSNDYEYEKHMGQYNSSLFADCETVYLFARPGKEFISSSGVKEVFRHSKNIEKDLLEFIPSEVIQAFKQKGVGP